MKTRSKFLAAVAAIAASALFAGSALAADGPARIARSELPGGLTVLTDEAGRTLYASTADETGVSNCTAECAEVWQPLLTTSRPIAGPGLIPGFIGSLERDEGTQVTFLGQPLYYYSGDEQPGDVLGQGIDDTWFVVTHMGALHTDEIVSPEESAVAVAFEVDEEVMEVGQSIYASFCAACHANDGSGAGGGPALAQGTNVGNNTYVIGQIVHGGAEMPSFGGALNDEEVAAVSTFVRNSFGNSYPPISPEEVEAVR